jgi:FlaA1/EpsC-like NDP-sugar epimerase
LDKNEFFLYTIERKLNEIGRKCKIIPFLADIKNAKSLQKLFKAYSPQIVIHAAAYKHVPMMESFPFEAVENNVLGTYNVIHYSRRFQAARIVIISTDKAVNPTCVMGATKRLSEMIAKSISNEEREHKNKKSKIMIVRFGNVLGSNGSVIPLFTEQIVNGLPVTVTHKDVTRYFMSIEEAAHLVLEAAVMGKGGEIFTLDMGKPVKILDLAREMISLNGLIPDKDIKIKFIGLRPGEKLEEELFFNNENRLPTHHPKIMIAQNGYQKSTIYKQVIQWIDTIDPFTSDVKIKDKLQKFIPEYHPSKRS